MKKRNWKSQACKSAFMLLAVILALELNGQKKSISCIKQSFFHPIVEDDPSSGRFLRTLWFESCNGKNVMSKQWQFNPDSEVVMQMLTYTNTEEFIYADLHWSNTEEEYYTIQLAHYDTISNKFSSFYAYIVHEKVKVISYEIISAIDDDVVTEIYSVRNAQPLLNDIINWMSTNRNSTDSLSYPDCVKKREFDMELLDIKTESNVVLNLHVFNPEFSIFSCGDRKIPNDIKKNSEAVKTKNLKLSKQRIREAENNVQIIYNVYYNFETDTD